MRSNVLKSLAVSDRAISVLAHVVAKCLFIQIAKQREWFDTHVGSLDSALEQAPEVFKVVSVDVSVHVGDGMVNDLVGIVASEIVVGRKCIGKEKRASGYVVADFLRWLWPLSECR